MASKGTRKGGDREESAYVRYLVYKSSGFAVGDVGKELVYVNSEDDNVYARAEVLKKDDAKFTAKLLDNPTAAPKEYANNEKFYMGVNPPKFDGVEDMAELGHLNEPAVLWNLTKRYDVDLFHTYSGLFLVIINPYKRLPIYTDEIIQIYTGRRRDQVAPHVFALADTAYRAMLQDRQNQSMLITGESGAGKTENTKKVIQYLAYIAGRAAEGGTLEQQLLEFNPILEAFGNAKTNKNNNSSRFGKFIELQFNAGGQIAGANTLIYLLEKSRVVFQAANERNFHVFYQLIAGATPEEKTKLHLSRCEDFNFLNQSGCTTVKYTDDSKEFEHTQRAFDILSVTAEQQWGVWEVIAAILHLGNVPFSQEGSNCSIKNDTSLGLAAELLGVDVNQLKEGLLRPRMIVGGGKNEVVIKGLNLAKVVASRDALVKALYGRLFNWIVHRINDVLSHPEKKALFVGVLDISGFEIFVHNSFEQLCINYTNERLQQFFNHHMFTLEQKEYEAEKIEWSFIDFGMDSQDTIDLIDKPPNGILTILDEQTNFPDATDSTFCRRLHRQNGAHRSFRKPRFEADTFKIIHYAGEVEYETEGWLEKNRDPLEDDLEKCMKSSKHELVLELFREGALPVLTKATAVASREAANPAGGKAPGRLNPGLTGKAEKSKIWNTVGTQYKEQLAHLMDTLQSTHPHFIRCILPNFQQRPGIINNKVVLDQLKCNGVLEGIRITRKGFPNRIPYPQFLKRYHLLKPGQPNNAPNPQAAVKELIEHLAKTNPVDVKVDQVRYGLTKVFFRTGQLPAIERLRERYIASMVISIQAGVRAYLSRRLYDKLREQTVAAKTLQRNLRAWTELREWLWWKLFIKARVLVEDVDWQKEIDDLKAKVKDLEAQVAQLTSERDSLSKSKATADENVTRMTKELDTLRNELQNVEDAKSDLEADKKLQLKKIEGLTEELDDETKLTKDLEGEKKRLEEKVLGVQNQLDDAENRIKDLQNEKAKVLGERDEWQDRFDDSEAAAKKLKGQVEELEKRLLDVEDQKFDAVGTSDLLRNKLRSAEESSSRLTGELAESQKTNSGLESTKRKLEADVDRVTKQLDEATKEKESLTAQVRKITQELTNSQSDLNSERQKSQKLDKQQAGLKARMREIEDIAEGAKDTEANAARTRKAMEDKLEEQNEILKDLQSEKRSLESRLNAARGEAEESSRLFEEAEATAKRWELEAKQRSQDINDMEADLEAERESGRKTKAQMSAKISELTIALEVGGGKGVGGMDWKDMQEELTRVRKELSEARDAKTSAEKGLFSITTERDDYKKQFEKVEGQVNKLRADNRRIVSELDDTKDQKGTAEAAREVLQKTNQEYLAQINELKKQLGNVMVVGGRAGFDQAALVKDNTRLKEELTTLDRKYRMLEIDARDVGPQLEDLRLQLELEKQNNAVINNRLKDKEKMLMEREMANARLISSMTDAHSSEKGSLLQEVDDLKVKNAELTTKANNLNDDYMELMTKFKLRSGQK